MSSFRPSRLSYDTYDTSMMHTILQKFTLSQAPFSILHSFSSIGPSPISFKAPVFSSPLYILDSSFNPPTQAHLCIATSALLHDQSADSSPKRLLLLLAIHNADKKPKAEELASRTTMMNIFAHDLLQRLKDKSGDGIIGEQGCGNEVVVDIGITRKPYFHDKAIAIEESGCYKSPETGAGPEQVYLLGFDTLIRLLDPKYYPPDHTLRPLDPFFERHRVRATQRRGEAYGEKEEQALYLRALANGEREGEGGRREWARRISLVEEGGTMEETVSSTKAREAVRNGDYEALDRFVVESVRRFIVDEQLYVDKE